MDAFESCCTPLMLSWLLPSETISGTPPGHAEPGISGDVEHISLSSMHYYADGPRPTGAAEDDLGSFSGSMLSSASATPPQLLSDWLDAVKPGYGARFGPAFDAAGVEDVDDLANVDRDIFLDIETALFQLCGAKPMHMKNIRSAVERVSGAVLDSPRAAITDRAHSSRKARAAWARAGAAVTARVHAKAHSPHARASAPFARVPAAGDACCWRR